MIQRYPFVMAKWIIARRYVALISAHWCKSFLVLSFLAITVTGLSWAAHAFAATRIGEWLRFLEGHDIWVALLTGLLSTILVANRRRQMIASLGQSWLASTPRAALTQSSSIALGTLWTPTWLWIVGALILFFAHLIGDVEPQLTSQVLLMVTAGLWTGACSGWLLGTRRKGLRLPVSRYIPKRRSTAQQEIGVSLLGLSHWPIARAFAWANPDTARWPLMAAMLSVTAGSSAITGLVVIGSWTLLLYMVALLNSTVSVAREAALWLRTTPIALSRFAAAVGRRSFIHQFLGGLVIIGLLVANRVSLLDAALLVSLWISFVLIAYSTTIAYSFGMRSWAGASIAAATIVLAALESLHKGIAIPFSLFVSAWQFYRCTRYPSYNGVAT
jgi:hypothetical protein